MDALFQCKGILDVKWGGKNYFMKLSIVSMIVLSNPATYFHPPLPLFI